MPIDIETFESDPELGGGSNAETVLAFLAERDDKAFRRSEIADGTGLDPDVVSAVLSRLKSRDVVRHRAPYWAIADERRLRTASDLSTSIEALNEILGAEDMDAWREASDEAGSDR